MRLFAILCGTSLLISCGNDTVSEETTPVAPITAPISTPAESTSWALTAPSTIDWLGAKEHTDSTHTGSFETVSGYATFAEDRTLEALAIQIDMNSLTSDDDRLTRHLKNEDFFDVPNHPTASFTMTSWDGSGNLTGNLEMRGIAHEITAPVQLDWQEEQLSLTGEITVDRTRWNVSFKSDIALVEAADQLIKKEIVITLDLQFEDTNNAP